MSRGKTKTKTITKLKTKIKSNPKIKTKKGTAKDQTFRVALLVPFSSDDPSRNRIWLHIKKWLEDSLKMPIVVGEHFPETPADYNLSFARNDASFKAGDWDVAIIHDADTLINPQQILDGVKLAYETGAVTYPFTERWELDFAGTEKLLKDDSSDWAKHLKKYSRNQPLGGCMIVRRDLWELVRGFDTGFVGWGHEDGGFAMACETLSGKKLKRIKGNSLHLEHTFAPAKRPDNPRYLANKERVNRYQVAHSNLDTKAMRALRDESIPTDTKAGMIWPKANVKNAMDALSALILLTDITNVLDKYKCTYWLSDGTLLGAIRENGFISYDGDMDLGIWYKDFDTRVIHELVTRYNCGIQRLQGRPDDGMVITLGRAGLHLDMFFYYPIKKSIAIKNSRIYSCLYLLDKPFNTSNSAKRFDCPFPDFKPLVKHTFMNKQFWVPKNAEEHLVAIYGNDWQTPKKDWTFEVNQENLKISHTVKDMKSERLLAEKYLKITLA